MKKEEIFVWDWQRLLFGNTPGEFLLEVLVRSLIVYFILLIVIRLLGKRMSGQLTITEMAVMLVLGAIVSVPMQIPERGILQGVLLLFLILFCQRALTWITTTNDKVERWVQGSISILIRNGVIQMGVMEKISISHEQLYAVLRSHNILSLGMVERMYQEASGDFSIYQAKEKRAGLSILPEADPGIHALHKVKEDMKACSNCGYTTRKEQHEKTCTMCGRESWENAVE